MNKICFFIGVFITLLLAGCSSNPISHVRVATFNIRYDNPGDSLNYGSIVKRRSVNLSVRNIPMCWECRKY